MPCFFESGTRIGMPIFAGGNHENRRCRVHDIHRDRVSQLLNRRKPRKQRGKKRIVSEPSPVRGRVEARLNPAPYGARLAHEPTPAVGGGNGGGCGWGRPALAPELAAGPGLGAPALVVSASAPSASAAPGLAALAPEHWTSFLLPSASCGCTIRRSISCGLSLWCDSERNVEFRCQLANPGFLDLFKIDGDRSAGLFVADAAVDAVAVVAVVALDIALRGQQFLAALFDFEVNMRRESWVRHRSYGTEVIFSTRCGHEAAKALEILVALVAVAGAAVQISAIVVTLPDFYDGVLDGASIGAENPPAQVGDFADGRRDRIVDNQQVVVGIQRQVIGVERPFGLRRRANQLLREEAGRRKKCRAQRS